MTVILFGVDSLLNRSTERYNWLIVNSCQVKRLRDSND